MDFCLYIDEVGNGELSGAATDPNIRYLALTGVLTRQLAHERIIQPQLDALKADLFGHSPDNPVILHRREIVRREGPFAVLRNPMKQVAFTGVSSAVGGLVPKLLQITKEAIPSAA